MGTPTFEDKVTQTIQSVQKSEDGKYQMPEGTDEAVAFAAMAELRRRDTQAAYTKNQQTLKALQAENEKLAQSWEQDAVSSLSATEQARLEELKVQDPDTWRQEIIAIEDAKRQEFQEKRTTIAQEAKQMSELERREQILVQFNEANPDLVITDEVIENDVPPRITNKLRNGDISFEEFLEETKNFLAKPKKIALQGEAPEDHSIAGMRGGSSPSDAAQAAQSSSDYNSEIF